MKSIRWIALALCLLSMLLVLAACGEGLGAAHSCTGSDCLVCAAQHAARCASPLATMFVLCTGIFYGQAFYRTLHVCRGGCLLRMKIKLTI